MQKECLSGALHFRVRADLNAASFAGLPVLCTVTQIRRQTAAQGKSGGITATRSFSSPALTGMTDSSISRSPLCSLSGCLFGFSKARVHPVSPLPGCRPAVVFPCLAELFPRSTRRFLPGAPCLRSLRRRFGRTKPGSIRPDLFSIRIRGRPGALMDGCARHSLVLCLAVRGAFRGAWLRSSAQPFRAPCPPVITMPGCLPQRPKTRRQARPSGVHFLFQCRHQPHEGRQAFRARFEQAARGPALPFVTAFPRPRQRLIRFAFRTGNDHGLRGSPSVMPPRPCPLRRQGTSIRVKSRQRSGPQTSRHRGTAADLQRPRRHLPGIPPPPPFPPGRAAVRQRRGAFRGPGRLRGHLLRGH